VLTKTFQFMMPWKFELAPSQIKVDADAEKRQETIEVRVVENYVNLKDNTRELTLKITAYGVIWPGKRVLHLSYYHMFAHLVRTQSSLLTPMSSLGHSLTLPNPAGRDTISRRQLFSAATRPLSGWLSTLL
jgi:hypothetical protein